MTDTFAPLHQVNMAVLSAAEKLVVQGVVEVMAGYQLTYKSSEHGMKLDPYVCLKFMVFFFFTFIVTCNSLYLYCYCIIIL